MSRLDYMSLGSRIRHYREKAGWTLEQLSERCGVDVGTISALENRGSQRSKYATAIAAGFGMTLNQLEDEDADHHVPMERAPAHLRVNEPSTTIYSAKLSPEETLLLQAFRTASEETRGAMLAFARSVIPDRRSFDLRGRERLTPPRPRLAGAGSNVIFLFDQRE